MQDRATDPPSAGDAGGTKAAALDPVDYAVISQALIAIAREVLYNPNWPMDAAQKLGVDKQFASVPSQQAYWLSKRAGSVKSIVPSTYQRGIGETR